MQQRVSERSSLKWLNLKLAVIAFFQRIIQVRSGMDFSVIFDLVVTFGFDFSAIFQCKLLSGVFQIFLSHQYALEGFRVEPECGAALETLVISVEIDVFEIVKIIIGRHVDGF